MNIAQRSSLGLATMSERLTSRWQQTPLPVFFAWWRRELLDCLPPWLKRRLAEDVSRLHLRWPLQGEPVAFQDKAAVLLLAPEQALQCELVLPRIPQPALRKVIGFELDKYSPFTCEQACFDLQVLADEVPAASMRLRLTLIERSRLDAIVQQVEARGIAVGGVDIVGCDGLPQGLDLLPPRKQALTARRAELVRKGLLISAAFMALACMDAWVERRQQALEVHRAQVAEVRTSALQVDAMRRQLQARVELERALRLSEAQRLTSVALLDLLSRCLPEQTWLDGLRVSADGSVLLSGSSQRASELPAQLSECAGLRRAVLQDGIQPDGETGRERFTLRAQGPAVQG